MQDKSPNVGEHTSEEAGDPGVVGSTLESDEFARDEIEFGPPTTAAIDGLERKEGDSERTIDR